MTRPTAVIADRCFFLSRPTCTSVETHAKGPKRHSVKPLVQPGTKVKSTIAIRPESGLFFSAGGRFLCVVGKILDIIICFTPSGDTSGKSKLLLWVTLVERR